MSDYSYFIKQDIRIKAEKIEAMLSGVKTKFRSEPRLWWFADMKIDPIKTVEDLFALFNIYDIEYEDETRDIVHFNFDGDSVAQSYNLFVLVAPYMEDGSFLEVWSDCPGLYRWTFLGGRLYIQEAIITFEEIDGK